MDRTMKKPILLIVAVMLIAMTAYAQAPPPGSTNHGTVQPAAQYSLPCYLQTGTTRILSGCPDIATDASGNLDVTGLLKTLGAGAGYDWLTQGVDNTANCPLNSRCKQAQLVLPQVGWRPNRQRRRHRPVWSRCMGLAGLRILPAS